MWWLIAVGALLVIVALYLLGTSGPKDVHERAKHIENRYDPDLPWWLSLWRRFGSTSRIKLLGTIKQENIAQMSVLTTESEIQQTELKADFAVENVKDQQELLTTTQRNLISRTQEATERNVSPINLDLIRFDEDKANTEVKKHREMKEIDMDVYQFEKEIDVKGAIIARIAEHFEIEVLTKSYYRMVDEREMLMLEPNTAARRKKLKRLDKNIKGVDKAIDVKEQRLIQGDNRLQLGTGDED